MAWAMVIASSAFSVFAYFLPTGYASILRTEAEDSSEKLVPYYKKSHSRVHNPSSCCHLVLSFHHFCPFFTSVWV